LQSEFLETFLKHQPLIKCYQAWKGQCRWRRGCLCLSRSTRCEHRTW